MPDIMAFFNDSGNWFLISFLVFAVIAWKMGKPAFLKMLDDRIDEIRKEVETAESLRVEAQELLAQYQRKYRDAAADADSIVEQAKQNAQAIHAKAMQDIQEQITRGEAQHKERMELMKREALNEIKAHAAVLAVEGARKMISEQLDKSSQQSLVSQSIDTIEKHLN